MSKITSFFNFSINKIISPQQSLLDQARIRLLYYGFWLVLVAVSGLWVSVYFQHQVLLTATATILFICILFLFKYLTYRPHWRPISHALLILATLVNLNNVFVAFQKVDIITIQVILLVILFSYYMLGQRWGLVYSLVNLIPILGFLVLNYNDSYYIPLRPEKVDQSTIIIGVFANFIIIIFVHSHFYSAFVKSIKQLKATSDEQQQLNTQLEVAIEKAEKSSQVKTEFLSTMSHEIRTPLNAVIGMSNLMMMGNPRQDQIENLDVLKFSANNLLAIVNDVLDFNKIEAGKVVFEQIKFNLPDLMQNICGGHINRAHEKGLEFDVVIDAALYDVLLTGDPTRLTQILFNLINNAIKFTRRGSIEVKAKCSKYADNLVTVVFSVKDTGIGIDKSNLESIFEPFTQESITTTRQYGGTGLGLAIVKRLLELQGLQMKVSSTIGEGSVFSFRMDFPLTIAGLNLAALKKQPILQTTEDLSSLKMLIAEDNPVNVLLMKKLLARWGIVPAFAENGERVIEVLEDGDYDIILMDLQMPVLNGFDATRRIRELPDPKKSGIPIIALTAAALNDIENQVAAVGMNDYISKPFKPEDLLEKIQNLRGVTV